MLYNHFLSKVGIFNRDIFLNIFGNLKPRDLLNAGLVSRYWHQSTQDIHHWQRLIQQHFPYLFDQAFIQTQPKAIFIKEIKRILKQTENALLDYVAIKPYLLASLRGEIDNIPALCLSREAKNELYTYAAANGYQTAFDKLNILGREKALLRATANGYHIAVQMILPTIENINTRAKALENAAENGHLEIFLYLLTGENEFSRRQKGVALKAAARNGHAMILKTLLSAPEQISSKSMGLSLAYAASGGHLISVRLLMKEAKRISTIDKEEALLNCAQTGQLAVVQYLLTQFSEAFSPEAKGQAFKMAAMNLHVEVVKTMLEIAKEILAQDKDQAFLCAVRHGDLSIVQIMLSLMTNEISGKMKGESLIDAARHGYLEVVQALLTSGGEQIVSWHIAMAFLMAAERGRTWVVQYLLMQAHDATDTESKGYALMYAASKGHFVTMQLILTQCEDISPELKGKSLVRAARFGHLAAVSVLLSQEGKVISTADKREALKYAIQKRHVKIAQLLFLNMGKEVLVYFKGLHTLLRGRKPLSSSKDIEALTKKMSGLQLQKEKQFEEPSADQPLTPPSTQLYAPSFQLTSEQNVLTINLIQKNEQVSFNAQEEKGAQRHFVEQEEKAKPAALG